MDVVVARSAGSRAKLVAIEVQCNGRRVALLSEDEEVQFKLTEADIPATLSVTMGTSEGKIFLVHKLAGKLDLECGVQGWTIFDLMNLFNPIMRDRALYLDKVRY